jgi:hypothetical protein
MEKALDTRKIFIDRINRINLFFLGLRRSPRNLYPLPAGKGCVRRTIGLCLSSGKAQIYR